MICDTGFSGNEYCDNMAINFEIKGVTTRKPHKCDECREEIPAKTKDVTCYTGIMPGEGRFSLYVCPACAEIHAAFKSEDDTVTIFGELWENMRDQAFPDLTTACFDRLTTAAAKQKLRDRWLKWKGL